MSRAILIIPRGSLTPEQARCLLRGEDGAPGTPGAPGAQGNPGPGVAAGGTAGQVLVKTAAPDYATGWGGLPLISNPAPIGTFTGTSVQALFEQIEASLVDLGMPLATNIANLDGINDYLSWPVAGAALPDEMTFAAWVKIFSPSIGAVQPCLFSTNITGSGTDAIALFLSVPGSGVALRLVRQTAAGVFVAQYGDSYSTATLQSVRQSEWMHIAFRLKRTATTSADVWVGGELYARGFTGFAAPPTDYGATAAIGANFRSGVLQDFVNGRMSQVRLYNRLLSRNEIVALARRGRPLPSGIDSGLVAYWPLETIGATTPDTVGSNTLTVNGGMGSVPMD